MRFRRHVFVLLAIVTAAGLGATAYSLQGEKNMKPSVQNQDVPIACNSGAFDAAERAKWRELGETLVRAPRARRELPDGYAFDLDRTPETLRDLTQFIDFESRCCPFMSFTLRVPAGQSVVSLELTGGPGVKELIDAELGVGRERPD
jgi:hypothetical protein